MKKKQKRRIIAITLVGAILAGIIAYNYHIDQIKIRGGIFSADIENIQDDLKQIQTEFFAKKNAIDEGKLGKNEFIQYSEEHFGKMEKIISRYKNLDTPPPFIPAVELLKLSTESQLLGDREIALWIKTGDEAHNTRATEHYQDALEFETSGLGEFFMLQTGS